jgi:toxin CcdB
MARFQVYRLKSEPILALDLQSNILSDLPSRVMVPLYLVGDMSWSISRLNPRFLINGEHYVMATQRMAALSVSEIGEIVADLTGHADAITAATDFLFQGF